LNRRAAGAYNIVLGDTVSQEWEIRTAFSRDEVVRRLNAGVDSYWNVLGRKPTRGHVNAHSFWFYKRTSFSNPLRPVVHGRLEGDAHNTRVVWRIGLMRIVAIFMTVWLTLFAIITAITIGQGARMLWDQGVGPEPFKLLGFAALSILFVAAFAGLSGCVEVVRPNGCL
jgi:hypothetical protein